jgi:hypothetical protein
MGFLSVALYPVLAQAEGSPSESLDETTIQFIVVLIALAIITTLAWYFLTERRRARRRGQRNRGQSSPHRHHPSGPKLSDYIEIKKD